MQDIGPCGVCGAPAVAVVNDRPACAEHLDTVMEEATTGLRAWFAQLEEDAARQSAEAEVRPPPREVEDVHLPGDHPDEQLPVLPYGTGDTATGGWSGSDTSRERAETERDEGTVTRRQRQALMALGEAGADGLTWKELGTLQGWHHGQASAVLSNLHMGGRIARLADKRQRCHPYVLPEHVNDRETQPHGGRSRLATEPAAPAAAADPAMPHAPDWYVIRSLRAVMHMQDTKPLTDTALLRVWRAYVAAAPEPDVTEPTPDPAGPPG